MSYNGNPLTENRINNHVQWIRGLSAEQQLREITNDIHWDAFYKIEIRIQKHKNKNAHIEIFYPRTLASTILHLFGNPSKQYSRKWYSTTLQNHILSHVWRWSISNTATLSSLFPYFYPRIYADQEGIINFDVNMGTLGGGYLIPLINDLNICKMKYDWDKQRLEFDFLYELKKCVLRGGNAVFVTC